MHVSAQRLRTDYRVLKEAGWSSRAGYKVTVVAANTYGPLERETRDGFEIIRVPVERARTRAERYVNLFPRAMWRMAEVAQQVGAAVYHAHDGDATVPAWLAARRVPGAKLIYDAHEVGFLSFSEMWHYYPFSWMTIPAMISGWSWQSLFEWIIRHKTDAVITVNDVLADLQAAHYSIPRPTVVMNCPPLAPVIGERRRARRTNGRGTGDADRDVQRHVCAGSGDRTRPGESAAQRGAAPSWRGRADGQRGHAPAVRAAARAGRVARTRRRAFVLPAVPPAEVATYLAGASIGVIPLQLRGLFRYASPNKLFEYMAVGLPVVYGDMPPVQAICEQYGCGCPATPARLPPSPMR